MSLVQKSSKHTMPNPHANLKPRGKQVPRQQQPGEETNIALPVDIEAAHFGNQPGKPKAKAGQRKAAYVASKPAPDFTKQFARRGANPFR